MVNPFGTDEMAAGYATSRPPVHEHVIRHVAVRRGVPPSEIRRWCAFTLAPIWQGAEHEVIFKGYFACFDAR